MNHRKERKLAVLRQARRAIARGVYSFICTAIYGDAPLYDSVHVCPRLREYILAQLEGHGTYEGWVFAKHPELMRERGVNDIQELYDMFAGECRRARLAWIDHMINLVENDEL